MRHHNITSELDRGSPVPPLSDTESGSRLAGWPLEQSEHTESSVKDRNWFSFFPLLTVLRPQGSHHPSPAKEMFDISEQN